MEPSSVQRLIHSLLKGTGNWNLEVTTLMALSGDYVKMAILDSTKREGGIADL